MSVQTNKACCTIPPVEAKYSPKGDFEVVNGVRTYVTGPKDATNLVVYVYDIFSYTPQAFQGADLVAAGANTRVYMPDFFEGFVPDVTLFAPPSSPEKQEKIQQLFANQCALAPNTEKLDKIVKEAKEAGYQKVGAIGFCWGAKITVLSSALDAKAGIHPSLLAPEDAEKFTVPTALWPTVDEDQTIMEKLKEALETNSFAEKNVYEHFADRRHGFAAARANLDDEKERADFHDAFTKISKFFTNVL